MALWAIKKQPLSGLTMLMDEQAQYVAIVALYRAPDVRKNDRRLVLNRGDLDPDDVRVIEMAKYSLYFAGKISDRATFLFYY